MGGGVHTWPPRQKVLRTACQIAGADAEDGQRNWIPGLTRLRHTSLVVWWSIVLGSTSFRHRSHDPTSINITATSYRFVSIGITVQGGTNKKIKKNKKKEKRLGGKGCVCN